MIWLTDDLPSGSLAHQASGNERLHVLAQLENLLGPDNWTALSSIPAVFTSLLT